MKGSTKVPMFEGTDYAFWSIRMKNHLMSLGTDVWALVLQGYDYTQDIPSNLEEKKQFWDHAKALNTLQSSLSKKVLAKVLTCTNAKKLWEKFGTIYPRDSKVKRAKLQTLKAQFEGLNMKEEENNSEYFQRIDELVNVVQGLGETVLDSDIVDKVLRTLPMAYNTKVSTIEDQENISSVTLDELYGILVAYELRIGRENHSKEKIAFKVLKKTEDQKSKLQSNPQEESHDEEEANFIKKLHKGSGKYKGKLPFKCFDCGKVGYFTSKCPYPKYTLEDEKDTRKSFKNNPFYKKNHYKRNKNFYSKEEDNNSNSSDNEVSEVLFLGIEEPNKKEDSKYEEESNVEAEVNMEAELLSALN